MKIVKIIISLTLLLLFSNVIYAQKKPKKSPEEIAERKEEMKQNIEKLQLSKEQVVIFIKILKRYSKKIKELRATNSYETEDSKQFRELKNNKDVEIKKLLSETQFNTYWDLRMNFEKKEKKIETNNFKKLF